MLIIPSVLVRFEKGAAQASVVVRASEYVEPEVEAGVGRRAGVAAEVREEVREDVGRVVFARVEARVVGRAKQRVAARLVARRQLARERDAILFELLLPTARADVEAATQDTHRTHELVAARHTSRRSLE